MLSKSIAIEVLNAGLETGGDFCEIYIEENKSTSISMDNSKVESCTDNLTYGAGIRILKDLQSVYGYTNDISKKGLLKLVKNLSASFDGKRIINVKEIKKVPEGKRNLPKKNYEDYNREDLIKLLKETSDTCLNYDEKIVRCKMAFAFNNKKVEIFNSDGKQFNDHHIRGRAFINAIASSGDAMETFGIGPGAQKGMEFFLEEVDLKKEAEKVAKTALILLDAKECPSGKMDVVIGNGFGGVIFHEACGHSLEATSVSKNLSVFSNKKGQKIASDIVSACDDGTIDGGWGSSNIDDEGNEAQRNILIKDGILTSYLVDDFNGRRMNEKGNGACRRESYRYEPTSRMSNTFIMNGKSNPEDIIKATKFGLYAKSMGGGSVNPTTGEFNFSVNEAYIIKDGEITYPVKGATLIGSGQEVLLNIDMVGNDLLTAQGMCGSSSGQIPADVGQPTIRVRNITVGGTGGKIDE